MVVPIRRRARHLSQTNVSEGSPRERKKKRVDVRLAKCEPHRVMWHLDAVPLKRLERAHVAGARHRSQERRHCVLVELVAWFGPLQTVGAYNEAPDVLRGVGVLGQGEQRGLAVLVGRELDGSIEEGQERRAQSAGLMFFC